MIIAQAARMGGRRELIRLQAQGGLVPGVPKIKDSPAFASRARIDQAVGLADILRPVRFFEVDTPPVRIGVHGIGIVVGFDDILIDMPDQDASVEQFAGTGADAARQAPVELVNIGDDSIQRVGVKGIESHGVARPRADDGLAVSHHCHSRPVAVRVAVPVLDHEIFLRRDEDPVD